MALSSALWRGHPPPREGRRSLRLHASLFAASRLYQRDAPWADPLAERGGVEFVPTVRTSADAGFGAELKPVDNLSTECDRAGGQRGTSWPSI